MMVIEWNPLTSRRRFQIPEETINAILSMEGQRMRADAVSLRNLSFFGIVGLLCMLLGGCGGGGSGSSGAVAGVQESTPGRAALWAVGLASVEAQAFSNVANLAGSGGLSEHYANLSVNQYCTSSGSGNAEPIGNNEITISFQNCTATSNGSTEIINGSGSLTWTETGSTLTCVNVNYPPQGSTVTFSLNKFSASSTNPSGLIAGNGQVVVKVLQANCTGSSLVLPIELTIFPATPFTGQLNVSSGSVNLNVSVSNLQIDEVVTNTTTSTGQTTTSITVKSGSYSINGVTYSFSTSQSTPITTNSNNISINSLSGGTLFITGPNDNESIGFSSSSTGESLVTVTKNGTTVVTNEPLSTYMGL